MMSRLLPYLWLLANIFQAIAYNLSPGEMPPASQSARIELTLPCLKEERPRLVVLTDMANEPVSPWSL